MPEDPVVEKVAETLYRRDQKRWNEHHPQGPRPPESIPRFWYLANEPTREAYRAEARAAIAAADQARSARPPQLTAEEADDIYELAVEGWEYAGDYFREKWDAVARLNTAHTKLRAIASDKEEGS